MDILIQKLYIGIFIDPNINGEVSYLWCLFAREPGQMLCYRIHLPPCLTCNWAQSSCFVTMELRYTNITIGPESVVYDHRYDNIYIIIPWHDSLPFPSKVYSLTTFIFEGEGGDRASSLINITDGHNGSGYENNWSFPFGLLQSNTVRRYRGCKRGERHTWRTLANILGGAWGLEADPPILTVMFLTHGRVRVVHWGDGSDLAERAWVAAWTEAAVGVEPILTGGAILADVRLAVIDVQRAVLPRVAGWAFAPVCMNKNIWPCPVSKNV